jgi:hypothetical protein
MTADHAIANIRIATPEDARALGAMHIASWHETYTGLLPDKMLSALSVESRAAAWAKIMREPATGRSTPRSKDQARAACARRAPKCLQGLRPLSDGRELSLGLFLLLRIAHA